jgi:hypothetical protein
MNFGTSFRASPLGNVIFLVETYTSSSCLKGASCLFLFAVLISLTLVATILSCAAISANFRCNANVRTPGYSACLAESQIIDLGIRPLFKKNGA